jgi:CubicO group peptidase (beta-lactamase class C family)
MSKIKISLFITALVLAQSACLKIEPYAGENFVDENGVGEPMRTSKVLTTEQESQIISIIKSNKLDAVTIIKGDAVIFNYGLKDLPMNCASVRKSIFSLLYGVAEARGLINLDATLKDLGIDDSKQPLTNLEKSATIRNLLEARSGIYLRALGESQNNIDLKPQRGSKKPGTYFCYNNFDFNLLPIILEKVTGKKLGVLIFEWLAKPLGMTRFKATDVTYQYDDYTDIPQTRIFISSEDLARLGSLVLQKGNWLGIQIVPEAYIQTSTTAVLHKDTDPLVERTNEPDGFWDGYAYLWWIDDDENSLWAAGTGGNFIAIDTTKNFTVVFRNNTGNSLAGGGIYNSTNRDYNDPNTLFKLIKSFL